MHNVFSNRVRPLFFLFQGKKEHRAAHPPRLAITTNIFLLTFTIRYVETGQGRQIYISRAVYHSQLTVIYKVILSVT